jgi:WD40 repeat protein
VSALAFSPDGDLLAAAGFREVRIWQRQPVAVEPAWPAGAGIHWLAIAFSADQSQLATMTNDGQLEVRASLDGRIIRSWPIPAAPRAQLVWTPDGKWIATAGTNHTVYMVSIDGQSEPFTQALSGEVRALEWFDQGRQLATVVAGTNTIQTWRLPEGTPTATHLESTGERTGHAATITALAAEAGAGGSLVSASVDGVVRRWLADPAATPQEIRVEASVIRLDPVGLGTRFVATLAGGGATLVEFGATNTVSGKFGGDPRLGDALGVVEHELALGRLELARAGTLITEAETATKSGDEALAKAREKRDGHVKALADKEKELTQQREVVAAATKERDELGAELQRVAEATQTADKALEEARATAKATAEAEGAALVAASSADRLKSELERLRAALPESDTSEAAIKTREAATTAANESATRSARGNEARAAAEKAREELASRAFSAGQRKAEADRVQADLPPRKKQAEERLAAAQKAIPGLNTQVDRARITLDGSTQDFALAEKAVAIAAASLTEAKAADEAARKRIATSEPRAQEIQSALAQAATVPPALAVATAGGSALLAINPDGLASQWELASGVAMTTFALANQAPLAVASAGAHQFLAVLSNRVVRVDTSRPWRLQRTIGNAEASTASGPFVDRVNALAFSPDGQLLATGGGEPSRGGELKLWQVIDGELVHDLGAVHSDSVMAVAFSPRGEWLATGGADRFARITPVVGDGPRINLEGHTHHVLGVAWQADGSTLATAGADGVVKLWNPKTGERRKNVEGFGKEVTGLRPVGITNQFVAVSGSGQGRVFRADGEKVRDLPPASAFLQALSATRDGSIVAGTGDDGVLRIWDLATGEQRLSLAPE